MLKNPNIKGYALVIASAVIFGCMPLMANYIYRDGVNSISLVLLRNLLSLPILAVIALIRRDSFKVGLSELPQMAVAGVFGYFVTPLLLFTSYNYIAGGTATVLHFVYPAIVLLIELIFLKARVNKATVIAVVICICGIAMFYNPAEELNLTGSLLALLSGLAFAVYIVVIGRLGKGRASVFVFSLYSSIVATVLLFISCICTGSLALPTSLGGWLLCIFFAFIVNVGAVVLFQAGTRLVGGQRASVLSTFEPITSLIAGLLAFGETVGVLSVIGAVLIIAASVVIALRSK